MNAQEMREAAKSLLVSLDVEPSDFEIGQVMVLIDDVQRRTRSEFFQSIQAANNAASDGVDVRELIRRSE